MLAFVWLVCLFLFLSVYSFGLFFSSFIFFLFSFVKSLQIWDFLHTICSGIFRQFFMHQLHPKQCNFSSGIARFKAVRDWYFYGIRWIYNTEYDQWSFCKTTGTLASQAEIGVWVQASAACWGGCGRLEGVTPYASGILVSPRWKFWHCICKIHLNIVFLNTLRKGTPFPLVPARNDPRIWSCVAH